MPPPADHTRIRVRWLTGMTASVASVERDLRLGVFRRDARLCDGASPSIDLHRHYVVTEHFVNEQIEVLAYEEIQLLRFCVIGVDEEAVPIDPAFVHGRREYEAVDQEIADRAHAQR